MSDPAASMFAELLKHLASWRLFDTWIALIAAVAAMSCAVPGLWLVLRRQSMLGDALSHSALPGVVGAFLVTSWMTSSGWISATDGLLPPLLLFGAACAGLLTAWLTEWIRHIGGVDSGAALGVVFISLFAMGLLLLRLKANHTDIHLDCVLLGQLDMAPLDRMSLFGYRVPRGFVVNALSLVANVVFAVLCFKELQLSAFDPAMATTQGVNARLLHYGHLMLTAITIVAAFRTVGSILVVALLIVPGATALLISKRLSRVLLWTLALAAASAVLGVVLARTVPPMLFHRLGFPTVQDAGSPGMIAVATGLLFLGAVAWGRLLAARRRVLLAIRIAAEDELGFLYRMEEGGASPVPTARGWRGTVQQWLRSLARRSLVKQRLAEVTPAGHQLTSSGRERGAAVVRAHRLFEAYMQRHFDIPDDHLHETAHRVEHFIDRETQEQLAAELQSPSADPHGRQIPELPK